MTKASEKYDQIRVEFVNSNVTLKELSTKHGVSYPALRATAARNKWTDERNRVSQKVTTEALAEQIKTRVSELGQFNADDLRMAKAIRSMAAKMLREWQVDTEDASVTQLRTLAQVVADAQKIGRLALGASTDNHELTGAGGGPIQHSDIPLQEYEQALERALEKY